MTKTRKIATALTAVAVVVLIALLPSPDLGHRRRGRSRIRRSDHVICSLVVMLAGQATFHKTDWYQKGELVYANPADGRGLADLHRLPDGTHVGLIDEHLARALDGGPEPRFGYIYTTLEGSEDGGPYEPSLEFAVCATPISYLQSGGHIYVMDTDGTIYEADAADVYPGLDRGAWVMPLPAYPSAKELRAHWMALGG